MTQDMYQAPAAEFYGLPVSRTNSWRLNAWGTWLKLLKNFALLIICLLALMSFHRTYVKPPTIDVEAISQRVDNEHQQIGAYAADFAELWRQSTTADLSALASFIDMKVAGPPPPRDYPAAVEAKALWAAVNRQDPVGEVDRFSVTVTVMEREIASAPPRRKFYRMPATLWKQQPMIVGWPVPVNGPGPGVHMKLAYRSTLGPGVVYKLITDFVSTYLTKTSGLEQYVVKGAPIWPVGGYTTGQVKSVELSEPLPKDPAPGQMIGALVQVLAHTSQGIPENQTMPLVLENNNGTWMISKISLSVALADAEPEPIGAK